MADIPATHYVKSDDVHIAYQVIGEGPRDLLFVPGFVSNVEAVWQSPVRAAFFRRLATFARVITFDKRGTGMSDRGSQIFTLEQRMHDVQAVLDPVGSQRHTLCGVTEGVRCRCSMQRPIPTTPWLWCSMALMRDARGRLTTHSDGPMCSGGRCWMTLSTTGARPIQ